MSTSENAMDSLLHLAEVAACMDPPAAAAAASAAPCTNAAQQLLNQPSAVVAALLQHQQQLQQQQQHIASTAAQACTEAGNDATALLQQLQRLKDALSQPTTGQKQTQQQQVSSMPLPRADAAMGSGSTHTMWHGASQLLQHPGAYTDPIFSAVGGLDDSLAGFMPIPSARISNSTNSSRPSAALQARADTTVPEHFAADEYSVGLDCGKQHWTDEEQSELEMLVAYYGDKNWSAVASHLPGRSEKQCKERYVNRPAKPTKGGWTLQEEFKLAYLHSQYGSTWAQIARQMPGRSDNCLRSHWNELQRWNCPGHAPSSSLFWLYTQGVQQNMAPADAFAAALSSLSAAQQASLAQGLAAATSPGAGGVHGGSSAGGNSTAAAAEVPHTAAFLPEGAHPAAVPVQRTFAPQPEPTAPAQAQSAAEALAAAAAMVVAAAATQAKGGGISQPAAEALAAAAAAVARAVAAPAGAQTNSVAGLPTSPMGHAAAARHSAAAAAAAKPGLPGWDGSGLTPAALAQMLTASPQLQAELEACLQRHQRQQLQQQEEQRLAAEHQACLQVQKATEAQTLAAEAAAAAAATRKAFIEHQEALAEQAAAAAAAAHQVYSTQQVLMQEQHVQQADPSTQGEEQQLQQAGSKRKAAAAKALSQQTEARLKRQQQSLQESSNDASGNAAAGVGAASDTAQPAVPAAPRAFQQALSAAAAAAAAGNGEAAAGALRQAASLAARTSSRADGTGTGLQPSADCSVATSSASADVLAPPSVFSALPSNGKTGLAALVSNLLASTTQKHHLQLQGARRADAAKLEAVLQNFTIGVRSSSAELSADHTGTAPTQSGQQGHHSQRQFDGSDVQKMRKRQERMRNLVVGALSCTTAVPPVGKKQLAARRDRQRALEHFLASRVPLPPAQHTQDQGPDMQMEQYGQIPAQPPLLVQQQQQQQQHLCMPLQQQAAAAVIAPSPPVAATDAATAVAPTQCDNVTAAAAGSDQQEATAAPIDTRAPAFAASSDDAPANSGAAATAAAHQVELMKLASTQEGKKLLESLKALGLLRTDLPPGAQIALQLVVSPPEAKPSAAAAASAAIAEPTALAAAAAASTAVSGNPPAPGSPDSNCSSKSSDPAAAVKLESQEQPVSTSELKPGNQENKLTAAAVDAETMAPAAQAVCSVKVEADHEAAVAASVSQAPAVAAGNAHPALQSAAQEQQREVQRAQPGREVVQHTAVTEPEGAQGVGIKRPITAVLGGSALSAAISAAKRVLHNSPAWKEVKL